MKFGVVIFPGSNCDHDIIYVLKKIMKQEVAELWHKDKDIRRCDFIILPGGFSYGDYLRSGAIAKFSPIMESVINYAKDGGYLLGICNGFQILCESGLLPGALLHNDNRKFICKNVFIIPQTRDSKVTAETDLKQALKIPIAHAEGRYYAEENVIDKLNKNDQVLFRYCDKNGIISLDANPNGSVQNIAGITNESKNVFGMMPHPERAADDELNNSDGCLIFESILSKAGVD